jgi:hypothetical protein
MNGVKVDRMYLNSLVLNLRFDGGEFGNLSINVYISNCGVSYRVPRQVGSRDRLFAHHDLERVPAGYAPAFLLQTFSKLGQQNSTVFSVYVVESSRRFGGE